MYYFKNYSQYTMSCLYIIMNDEIESFHATLPNTVHAIILEKTLDSRSNK